MRRDEDSPQLGDPEQEVRWLSEEQQRIWRDWLLGSARIHAYLCEDLRRHGLDLAEYEILTSLSEAPDRSVRMSVLAVEVHQSRSRLTHAVERLERRGLVERVPATRDRRGVVARLTPDGLAVLRAAAPDHVRAVRHIFLDAVDPADYAALGRVMRAVLSVPD